MEVQLYDGKCTFIRVINISCVDLVWFYGHLWQQALHP